MPFFSHGPVNLLQWWWWGTRGPAAKVNNVLFRHIFTPSTDSAYYNSIQQHLLCEGLNLLLIRFTDTSQKQREMDKLQRLDLVF